MEQTPLLTHALCQQELARVSLTYWHDRWLCLQKWWTLTTHVSYLSSDISRRDVAKPLWLVAAFFVLLYDLWFGILDPGSKDFQAKIAILDTVMIGYMFTLLRQSTRDLLFDYRLSMSWAIYCVLYRAAGPAWAGDTEVAVVLLSLCTGIHASAQVLFVVTTSISTLVVLHLWEFSVNLLIVGTMVFIYSGVLEYRSACLLSQLQHNTIVRESLLDLVTDGFCEVDIVSGIITGSSPNFERTLGRKAGLRGGAFSSLLHAIQDKGALDGLLGDARAQRELNPLLITCRSLGGTEFDSKLIPLPGAAGNLTICLQRLGEMRDIDGDCSRGHAKSFEGDEFIALAVDDLEIRETCVLGYAANDLVELESRTEVSGWSGSLDSLQYSVASGESIRATSQKMITIREHEIATGYERAHIGTQTSETGRIVSLCKSTQTDSFSILRPPQIPPATHVGSSPRVILNTRHRAMRRFKETPKANLQWQLAEIMLRANLCGKGCCYWHIALASISQNIKSMMAQLCKTNFKPHSDWQCQTCFLMQLSDIEDGDELENQASDFCSFCLSDRETPVAENEDHSSSQHSSADDSTRADFAGSDDAIQSFSLTVDEEAQYAT